MDMLMRVMCLFSSLGYVLWQYDRASSPHDSFHEVSFQTIFSYPTSHPTIFLPTLLKIRYILIEGRI